jgi:hypothetical protein
MSQASGRVGGLERLETELGVQLALEPGLEVDAAARFPKDKARLR